MIRRFRVQNYKALRDVTLDLTPVHVLVGPNDSGKTSLLEAVAALCRSVDRPFDAAFLGRWDGLSLTTLGGGPVVRLSADVETAAGPVDYNLAVRFHSGRQVVIEAEELGAEDGSGPGLIPQCVENLSGVLAAGHVPVYQSMHEGFVPALRQFAAAIRPVSYARWDPKNLALPVALNADRGGRIEASGFGLATALDAVKDDDFRRYAALEDRFRAIFPHVNAVKLRTHAAYDAPVDPPDMTLQLKPAQGKAIEFAVGDDGRTLPASQASDGMLYVLGYLALLHAPDPPKVLLIEEPENGIHPHRLTELLAILRDLVGENPGTQVLMTTHSPYAVSEFAPEEVTLCRRGPDGMTRVRRLSEYEAVREQIDFFTLGEIWASEEDQALREQDEREEPSATEPAGVMP